MIEWCLFSSAIDLLGPLNETLKAIDREAEDPHGDDDESYPPHLNEELESEQGDEC